LPFTGTVDWPRLACLIAQLSYRQCVSLEVVMRHSGIVAESIFLENVFTVGKRLTGMIAGTPFDTFKDSR